MKSDLNAFISYRRDDAFCHLADGAQYDFSFIRRLRAALMMAGFTNVFVDIDGIAKADDFKQRIRKEIKDSDLFVPVIGSRWLDILKERSKRPERDVLVREIRTAIRNEKEILPVLVDDAPMPAEDDLPSKIEELHDRDALKVSSAETLETLVEHFTAIYQKVATDRRRKDIWRRAYITGAVLAYVVCAVLIHIVGNLEYGPAAWQRMAQIWSGFFLWPIVCLPFALVALYRPLTIVLSFAMSSARLKDAIIYVVPLLIGLAVTLLAITVEVLGEYETPWTTHPTLAGCTDGRGPVESRYDILAKYDAGNTLAATYAEPPFWLRDKCWPNVLFYLVEPAYKQIEDTRYFRERPGIERAFVALLNRTSSNPYSWLFYVYVLSFSIQIWLAATGVILAIFYVSQSVRAADGRVLKLPSEDTYICLTYAFVTLMIWVPFRLNTVYIKNLYFCPDLANCTFQAQYYQNDIVLGVMFLIAYIYLTAGLVRKFRRLALSIMGIAAVAGAVSSAVLIVVYSDVIARMAQSWQFYLRVLIVVLAILFALWMQFDPERVHDRDDDEEDAVR